MGKWQWYRAEENCLEKLFGNIAKVKDGSIVFKCGSPNSCSQCARCGSPKDARAD